MEYIIKFENLTESEYNILLKYNDKIKKIIISHDNNLTKCNERFKLFYANNKDKILERNKTRILEKSKNIIYVKRDDVYHIVALIKLLNNNVININNYKLINTSNNKQKVFISMANDGTFYDKVTKKYNLQCLIDYIYLNYKYLFE